MKGDQGIQGESGERGRDGAKGERGFQGSQGERWPQGERGYDGYGANRILGGEGIPAINKGSIGDWYIDRTNKTLYGPKSDTGWGSGISLRM